MKTIWKRIIPAVVIMFAFYGMLLYSQFQEENMAQVLEDEMVRSEGLCIWYSDSRLTSWLESAAADYAKENKIDIQLKLVSSTEYLEQITDASVSGSEAPDLYILRDDLLKKAFMLGITADNNMDGYTEDNFCVSALEAARYEEEMIAFPLAFHTSCFVRRGDVIGAPRTLMEMITLDFTPYFEMGMERSINFNTEDILSNYAFTGNCFDPGDKTEATFDNIDENLVAWALSFYNLMVSTAGVTQGTNEDTLISGYAGGKELSLILNTDHLRHLSEETSFFGVNYEVMEIPYLTDELKSKTASYTDMVVVNGMSQKQIPAADFARFLTVDRSNGLYETAGIFPACRNAGDGIKNFNEIYAIYENSTTMPKHLELEDLSLRLELMFEKVLNGTDALEAAVDFKQGISMRLDDNE